MLTRRANPGSAERGAEGPGPAPRPATGHPDPHGRNKTPVVVPGSAGVPPASGPKARPMAMRAGRPRSRDPASRNPEGRSADASLSFRRRFHGGGSGILVVTRISRIRPAFSGSSLVTRWPPAAARALPATRAFSRLPPTSATGPTDVWGPQPHPRRLLARQLRRATGPTDVREPATCRIRKKPDASLRCRHRVRNRAVRRKAAASAGCRAGSAGYEHFHRAMGRDQADGPAGCRRPAWRSRRFRRPGRRAGGAPGRRSASRGPPRRSTPCT